MRCPDCNKFVSLESGDPELDNDPEIDQDGNVSCSVTIVRQCAECGNDLKGATLEMETQVDVSGHTSSEETEEGDPRHDLLIEANDPANTEEGGGRYKKSYYGAEVSFTVTCACQEEAEKTAKAAGKPFIPWSVEGTMDGNIAAGQMDELI